MNMNIPTLLSVKIVALDLDKVTNFWFTEKYVDKETARIYFICPGGNYDKIQLNCSGDDQYCSGGCIRSAYTTGNCSSCNCMRHFQLCEGLITSVKQRL